MIYKKIIFKCNSNSSWFENASLSNLNKLGRPMTHDSQKIEMNPNSIYCKIGNLAAITVEFTTKQNIEAYNKILDNIPHSQYWSLCYARERDTGTWKKMYVWGTNLFSHEMLNADHTYELSVAYVSTI